MTKVVVENMEHKNESKSPFVTHISPHEYLLCQLVWEQGSIPSPKLVKLCKEQFQWSKSTTYTVIRKLSAKGILVNTHAIVSALISREDVQKSRLLSLIQNDFDGSPTALLIMLLQILAAE